MSSQLVAKSIFCFLYVLFTAPVIKYLHSEITCGPSEIKRKHVDALTDFPPRPLLYSGGLFLQWLIVMWVVYGFVTMLGNRYAGHVGNGADTITEVYHHRVKREHKQDCLCITAIFGFFFFPVVLQPFLLRKPFISWFLYFFLVHSALFRAYQKLRAIEAPNQFLSSAMGKVIFVVTAIIPFVTLGHHVFYVLHVSDGDRSSFRFGVAMVMHKLFHGHLMKMIETIGGHGHCYYWPIAMINLSVCQTSDVSMIMCAMCYAIEIHGISFYGYDYLMTVEVRQHNEEDEVRGVGVGVGEEREEVAAAEGGAECRTAAAAVAPDGAVEAADPCTSIGIRRRF